MKSFFPGQKIGHAGTLDPMASGLVIVAVGDDTKKLSTFLKLDKSYEAVIQLGVRTDTGDITGTILETKEVPNKSYDDINRVLLGVVGTLDLHVPQYSAISVDGQRLYKKARRGETFITPVKQMKIIGAELLGLEPSYISASFKVGSGTYIRSLVEEIGRRLGTVATLSLLRRITVGEFCVGGSTYLENFSAEKN